MVNTTRKNVCIFIVPILSNLKYSIYRVIIISVWLLSSQLKDYKNYKLRNTPNIVQFININNFKL